MTTSPLDDRIPEDRVAGILARAAEIDRTTRETVSVEALRTAALDAGISASAMDAALAEYAGADEPAVAEPDRRRTSRFARLRRFVRTAAGHLGRPLRLGALALLLGLAGAAGEGAVVIAWAIWLFLVVRSVVKHRPERKALGFVLTMVLTVVGMGLGFGMAGVDADVVVSLMLGAGPALLLAGMLVIKLRLPKRFRSGDMEGSTA